MKKALKISAFIIALLLIIGVCSFADSLVGNPVSKAIAWYSAEKHINNEYSDKDFEIEKVIYNFKDGNYHAFIYSPTSIDSDFTVVVDMWGNVKNDSYADRVTSGWNVADRIRSEYRAVVDSVIDSKSFPYSTYIGFGDFDFYPREHLETHTVEEHAIITEDLIPDAFYNLNDLGEKHGRLTLYVEDDTVTIERLTEIMLDVKNIFDNAGVKFYIADIVLEYPRSDEGKRKEGRVEVMDFLCSDIYEDGLSERVYQANEAAKAYYEEEDKRKN